MSRFIKRSQKMTTARQKSKSSEEKVIKTIRYRMKLLKESIEQVLISKSFTIESKNPRVTNLPTITEICDGHYEVTRGKEEVNVRITLNE